MKFFLPKSFSAVLACSPELTYVCYYYTFASCTAAILLFTRYGFLPTLTLQGRDKKKNGLMPRKVI